MKHYSKCIMIFYYMLCYITMTSKRRIPKVLRLFQERYLLITMQYKTLIFKVSLPTLIYFLLYPSHFLKALWKPSYVNVSKTPSYSFHLWCDFSWTSSSAFRINKGHSEQGLYSKVNFDACLCRLANYQDVCYWEQTLHIICACSNILEFIYV